MKDSVIWISLRSFAIEGMRLCISKDSIKMIDRINNKYYYKDYESFARKLQIDIDYNSIQSIITNSFFFYPCSYNDNDKLINNFTSCSDKNYYCISSISRRNTSKYFSDKLETSSWERKLYKEKNEINEENDYSRNNFVFQIVKVIPNIFKIKNIYLENYLFNQSLYISYDNHVKINDNYFPQTIEFEIMNEKISFFVKLSISKIELDKKDNTYPIKYTKKMTALEF